MRRIAIVLFLSIFMETGFAQQAINSLNFDNSKGKYRISFYAGNVIRVNFIPANYKRNEQLSDAVIARPVAPAANLISVRGDSIFLGKRLLVSGVHTSGDNSGFRFTLVPGEKIYGGGERAIPLDRRGYRLSLYNNPWYGYTESADALNYSVPFFTSSAGYGLFFDNPSRSYVDIGKANTSQLEYGAVSGALSVYIIPGDPQKVLEQYYKLTGTQPLPPRWALGNLMSRFGYNSEQQVKDIYDRMRADEIPVDAVIFDLFWFGDSIKGTLGNLSWVNRQRWPNPQRMIAGFKKEGVQTILVTEPFFVETSRNYKASLPFLSVDSLGKPYYLKDFYFGKGGLIDIFRKDAQAWFWRFYKQQMQLGVEAWWGDLGEPEKHPADLYHNMKDLGGKRLFSADEVHNIYGHNWTKMLYQFYAKEYPSKRLFSLNRSGFAGSQHYSIFPWTGDVSRSWSGLRAQLPVLLGMSMSGVPYVHSDAGGFAGGEGDTELYVRWLQFAAFTPIFRPHGTALYEMDTAAFSFPSEPALIDYSFKAFAKNAVSLRYLFLPYNYTLAWQQAKWGKPLMAPLYYHFGSDTTAAAIGDQYMWGEQVMVAPVLEKGQKTRRLYLPSGRWLNLFSSQVYEGGKWIELSTSMTHIPVFIREGAFVPTVSRIGNVSEYLSRGQFMINYFPSAKKTSFTWYEDDGQDKGSMAGGKYTLIQCNGQDEGKKVRVMIKPSNKQFLPRSLAVNITLGTKPASVLLNGLKLQVVTDASKVEKGGRYALWMPAINSIQVYASMVETPSLSIEIEK